MKRKGISLIVLIVTIIVVIILAAVVILTLSKNNPIESAKEARFKEDVRTFQDELSLYISKQYANAGGHWDENISAATYDEIVDYIPSFTKKYEGKFIINNNNLEYTNKLDEKEKEYAKNLNVRERINLLPGEYQQVEYIESTGNQYLDTGLITSDKNIIYETRLKWRSLSSRQLFGANFGVYFGINSLGKYQFGQTGDNGIDILASDEEYVDIKVKYNYKANPTNIQYQVNNVNGIYERDFGNNEMIKLFCTNGIYSKASIKYFKIYIDDSLTRNFTPCYTLTTVTDVNGRECPKDTVGLYDIVEGKFYTNQGTGEFIAGPDVNE